MYCSIRDYTPEYEAVKKELLSRVSKAKHFTKEFYEDYLNYREKVGNGSDGETITLLHDETIKNSDFYKKESCEYCEFLCVYYGFMNKYRIDFYKDAISLIERKYDYFECEEYARSAAKEHAKELDCPFFEVIKAK